VGLHELLEYMPGNGVEQFRGIFKTKHDFTSLHKPRIKHVN